MELEEILRRKFYREQLERQGGPDFPALISCDGMTDSEKNDFINFIYGQLKEREAQNEALHAKLDAQMDRFDKLQATLDAISSQLAESNKMKEVLQKGFDNMQAQLIVMKDELGLDEDVEMMEGAAPEWFPGTHATIDMLVELVFNKYVMETPVYREMTRLMEQRFKTCRQTVQNWLARGAKHLKHIVPVLKEIALEKDSIVHCDETWCRVKIMDKYKKAYIWCLVNKSAKIIIFFYDNGSRGRKVLTDFIGEAEIAALQSDAYNVYKYLDSELTEIEHVCCMAHVRARFLKALIQGKDERARFFLDRINELYAMEAFYKKNKFPPDRIKGERHNARTIEIITEMRMELTRLLTMEEQKSDLLTKALNYLDNSWDQVMAWRNDGRYNIDNSEAERNIRPMTIERSNSKSFGSHEGVEISAVYHTIIATCKAQAVSVCEYLKQFFTACVNGRTDYENLTPMMLCQPVK